MNSFSENYVKQEPISKEDSFLTVIPPPPNVTCVMPPKTEPFFKEDESLVTVKNEPVADDGFRNTMTPLVASPVSNEIFNTSNNTSHLANSFVIYELDPQAVSNIYLQDNAKIKNVPIITTAESLPVPPPRLLNVNNKSKITKRHPTPPSIQPLQKRTLYKQPYNSTSTFSEPKLLNAKVKAITNNILNAQQGNKNDPSTTITKFALEEKSITTKSIKQPILLNTQLRKRSQLTGNTKAEINLSNKKTCYNMQDVEILNVNRTPLESATNLSDKNADVENSIKSIKPDGKESNNAKKKIINYIMRKKRVERMKKIRMDQTSTWEEQSKNDLRTQMNNSAVSANISLKNNYDIQNNQDDIVVKTETLNDDQETDGDTVLQNTTISIQYPCTTSKIPTTSSESLEYVHIKEEQLEANILDELNPIEIPPLNVNSTPPHPATFINLEPIGKITNCKTPISAKSTSEIKVKCLCRLTGDNTSDDQPSSTSEKDLKDFFHKMFQETRRMNKQQQRTVKMSLLQAICEAEEMVEKGKCCCF